MIDFPEKIAVTQKGEKVGPAHYIAPEMLNAALGADGKMADVYSLGKLLWKLACGQNYPLPGMHFRDVPALTISGNVVADNTTVLDGLLETMTQIEPDRRPTMEQVARELSAWLAPPSLAPSAGDLSVFTKAIQAFVDPYNENRRRRAELQKTAESLLASAFGSFASVLAEIKADLERGKVGAVTGQPHTHSGGNGEFFWAVTTGDREVGRSDRTWMFQSSVEALLDAGDKRVRLKSGLNIGVKNVVNDPDTLFDIYAPSIAAAGHILTTEVFFGDRWDVSSRLLWGDEGTLFLGQPTEPETLSRLGKGLLSNLGKAVAMLVEAIQTLRQPKPILKTFTVSLRGATYELVVCDQRHLDAITAHANASGTSSEPDYLQTVMSSWAEGSDIVNIASKNGGRIPDASVQAAFDRAIESYRTSYALRRD